MSTTLNLVDRLFARGCNYHDIGRAQDALYLLGRLAGFRELPAEVAEQTQARLADLWLRRRKFHRARRCLTAALRHAPASARYHFLMASAVEADRRGDPERAAEHYRRSLELQPDQPECLGKYGLLAVRLGRTEEGLQCLRRAVELAPGDPEPLRRLVKGLQLANRSDEARKELRLARFRNPRDPRFRKLADDFLFDEARRQQEAERIAGGETAAEKDGPVLLPFVRPANLLPAARKRVRFDAPSSPPPPHAGRTAWLPGRRRVQ